MQEIESTGEGKNLGEGYCHEFTGEEIILLEEKCRD